MNLDPFDEYTILKPDLSVFRTENELPNIDSVYTYALTYMPEMQESMSRITSSTLSFKITQSSLFPTLTLSAGIFTNYTSNGVFDPITFQVVDVPYFTQLQDNISQSLSLNMSIPIFNRRTIYRNIKNAQLNVKLANVQLENTKNILVKKIQQAYQDAYASKNKFLVTQEQLSSLKLNYNNSKMRYENGILDLLSFNESLNNLTRAETELLQAQYDFIFKYKILDLYQGKEIKF
jgi:outer membrane protein